MTAITRAAARHRKAELRMATFIAARAVDLKCDWCDHDITGTPVRNDVAHSWLGRGAPTYCTTGCLTAAEDAAIEAEANR